MLIFKEDRDFYLRRRATKNPAPKRSRAKEEGSGTTEIVPFVVKLLRFHESPPESVGKVPASITISFMPLIVPSVESNSVNESFNTPV